MLRMRRRRIIRILVYILLFGSVTYLFYNSTTSAAAPKTKYASSPTYEYISAYRLYANRTFEATLDDQLQTLERTIRSSLPSTSQNPIANATIHQITTAQSAAQFSSWVKQWQVNNPGWAYNLLSTQPTSLLSLYASIPSIATAFETYPSLRPDLTRYLMLWYHSGFYADINTWERQSLKDCQPIVEVTTARKDVSLMVGVERDEPFYNQWMTTEMGWSRGFGFGTSVIWAPRRFDPILRNAIVRSISHAEVQRTLDIERRWENMFGFGEEESWQDRERWEISGAGMLTDVLLEVLSQGLKDGHELRDRDAGLERRVSWKKFKGLKETLWIGRSQAREGAGDDMRGIAVLPINIWSNGQNHSNSGPSEAEGACVNHFYAARPKKEWYEGFFW